MWFIRLSPLENYCITEQHGRNQCQVKATLYTKDWLFLQMKECMQIFENLPSLGQSRLVLGVRSRHACKYIFKQIGKATSV